MSRRIREALGFRETTWADEESLIDWLATEICPVVLTDEGVRAATLTRCRKLKIEPPGRIERILRDSRAGSRRRSAPKRWPGCQRRRSPGWRSWRPAGTDSWPS